MSVPCEEIRPELEALLGSMTEGGLDADGRRRLAAILRDHPDARQYYLDYCQMHSLLESAHGVLHALEAPPRKRGRLALAAAAAGLAIAPALLWRSSAPAPLETAVTPSSASVWLVRDGKRMALGEAGPMVEGDRLVTGQENRTDVRLRDGTRVHLRDLTEARFGHGRVDLNEGLLRCEAAPQPPDHPLVFATRHAEARVLGTVFEMTSSWNETRLETLSGRVRLSGEGRSVEVKGGEIAVADGQGVVRWEPVCAFAFSGMKELPSGMETVFSPSATLHTSARKVDAAPGGVHFSPGGLVLGPKGTPKEHGLVVARWKEEVGDDLLMEAEVAGGERWSLGFSLSGDSFEGYRVIFAVFGYPNGIAIDTIHPVECVVLASDPRTISYEKDHTLRLERRGRRMRVWIDRELRLDTEITHSLPEGRKRTFALSNFGAPPVIRSLRVWKAASP
jgi:ferric-dicitrate binding protein FerR (iron transport regulator)